MLNHMWQKIIAAAPYVQKLTCLPATPQSLKSNRYFVFRQLEGNICRQQLSSVLRPTRNYYRNGNDCIKTNPERYNPSLPKVLLICK